MVTIYLKSDEVYDAADGEVVYASSTGNAIFGVMNNTFHGDAGEDALGIGTNSKAYGGEGNDSLELFDGFAGGQLFGDAGNDILVAHNNPDGKAFGGAGDDLFLVGTDRSDSFYIDGGSGTDDLLVAIDSRNDDLTGYYDPSTKISKVGSVTFKNVENVRHDLATYGEIHVSFGNANDDVTAYRTNRVFLDGGGGNDTLRATGGGSRLLGGDGNDILSASGIFFTDQQYEGSWFEGGKGSDTMIGGTDGDFFVFGQMGKNDRDIITRFDNRDTLLSAVAIKDSNGDGVIDFGSDRMLGIGSGKIKITGADGAQINSLVYNGEVTMFDQRYYSYVLANHEEVTADMFWAP